MITAPTFAQLIESLGAHVAPWTATDSSQRGMVSTGEATVTTSFEPGRLMPALGLAITNADCTRFARGTQAPPFVAPEQ
jgi:hypothetical protein